MKKIISMIAFLIGLTFSLTYINAYPFIYNDMPGSNLISIDNIIMEPELELEDWMLELLIIHPSFEQEIELEDWMINLDDFYKGDQIHEKPLELENWMLESPFEQESGEEELILENWMFSFS